MATYKCPSLGDCEVGMSNKIIERAPGEDLHCPSCKGLLDPYPPNDRGVKKTKPPVIAAIVGAAALVIGGGSAFYFIHAHKAAQEEVQAAQGGAPAAEVASASTSAVIAASVPAATVAAQGASEAGGIAPPAEDIAADRKAGDEQLTSGDAAGAESASNRAAAKEMIKVAIADMAQGKLDDAEKELNAAQARDPKQSLVYYNLGVLRLKQSRTDDALKAFEASFLNGFQYFDAMEKDPDLDVVRHDPRFETLVNKYRRPATT
ncbi:tetratricopeptide repeat protein (plasmid) [Paraburkholderia sp. PREW-6R]|uniref:TPR end-of-group domain-containing protein n=1 Tax=Paraburkholderia sp. PREW-6R TaxID=3141544 RepID=UPI0031F554C5